MIETNVPDYVEADEIIITVMKEMGLVSYQAKNIRATKKVSVTINGVGRDEEEAKTNFDAEWKNRSRAIFGKYVPLLRNCKKDRKKV